MSNNNSMEMDEDSDLERSSKNISHLSIKSPDKPSFECVKPKGKSKSINQMWIEKYRPSQLNGVISHDYILNTIGKLVNARELPHLLFYGPAGTGKTTTILACARKLNGKQWKQMTLELNASDERGINVIRDKIKTFASTQQIFLKGFKLIILDEADSMTSSAQFALRRIIEKYTKNTRFCLICNYVNKIIPALQSRCTKFRFGPLPIKDMKSRLNEISRIENIKINDDSLNAIMKLSGGDMRKCINILQSCYTAYKNNIKIENVYECTGNPLPKDIESILNLLLNSKFKIAFDKIKSIQINKGLALNDIINGLHELIIKMNINPIILCNLLTDLSDLQNRLTVSTNINIQLSSLVAIFQKVRYQSYKLSKKK